MPFPFSLDVRSSTSTAELYATVTKQRLTRMASMTDCIYLNYWTGRELAIALQVGEALGVQIVQARSQRPGSRFNNKSQVRSIIGGLQYETFKERLTIQAPPTVPQQAQGNAQAPPRTYQEPQPPLEQSHPGVQVINNNTFYPPRRPANRHAAQAANRICHFFDQRGGCRNGSDCRFRHSRP